MAEHIAGVDGAFPEYRHVRDLMIRPVSHTLGDQPEDVDDQPVYPPHIEPPPPEEPPVEPPVEEVSGGKAASKTTTAATTQAAAKKTTTATVTVDKAS